MRYTLALASLILAGAGCVSAVRTPDRGELIRGILASTVQLRSEHEAGISRAAFLNTGQICLGTERVYVERPVFERFVAALRDKAQALKSAAGL